MKDKSVKLLNGMKPVTEEDLKDCKYVLVPIIEYGIDGYIMIEPNDQMIFTKATVDYQLCVRDSSIDDEYAEYVIEDPKFIPDEYCMFPIHKEVGNIIELYNVLHSINKLEYVNYIYNKEAYDSEVFYDITYFRIEIFNRDDRIYGKEIGHINPQEYGIVDDMSQTVYISFPNLLESIEDIYNIKLSDTNYCDFLCISNDMWSIKQEKDLTEYDMIGVALCQSSSLFFINKPIFALLDGLDRLEINMNIFNRGEVPDYALKTQTNLDSAFDNEQVESYFSIYCKLLYIGEILEFMLYMKSLQIMILTMYNYVIFDPASDAESFDMYVQASFFKNMGKHEQEKHTGLTYSVDTIPDFYKLLGYLSNGGG